MHGGCIAIPSLRAPDEFPLHCIAVETCLGLKCLHWVESIAVLPECGVAVKGRSKSRVGYTKCPCLFLQNQSHYTLFFGRSHSPSVSSFSQTLWIMPSSHCFFPKKDPPREDTNGQRGAADMAEKPAYLSLYCPPLHCLLTFPL